MRSTFVAAIAVLALLSLLPAAMAGAQSSPNSLLLGTITADGQPAPSLRTVLTVTSGGVECGNTIPQGGTFSMLLSCPAGVAYVNVNGVPVAAIQVVPLGNVVVHLSIPAVGPPTPIPTGATPILPTVPPTPRVPVSGNTAAPAQDGSGSMPLVALGGLMVAAAFLMIAKVAASAGSDERG